MRNTSDGIFRDGKKLFTLNAVLGKRWYGERLVKEGHDEYREWNPERSKLGAALVNGLQNVPLHKNSKVLYLGASTGTTVSHISDIVSLGVIYSLEFAERVFRGLLDLSAQRSNIVPLFVDARKPETYSWIELCDVVFVDISQSDEVEIAIRNAEIFLRPHGMLLIAIKSQSIDVTKNPEQIYKASKQLLEQKGFVVKQVIDLEPYEKKHALIAAEKK